MKAKSSKGEDEADEARRQLRLLPLVLKCDHFIELKLKCKDSEVERSQLEELLSECNVQLEENANHIVVFQQKKKKGASSLCLGLVCGQSLDVEAFNGLVMGPDPSSLLQVRLTITNKDLFFCVFKVKTLSTSVIFFSCRPLGSGMSGASPTAKSAGSKMVLSAKSSQLTAPSIV